MLPAEPVVPATGAAQVAPAEAARIAAVLRAALSRATIEAYTLRFKTYTEWAPGCLVRRRVNLTRECPLPSRNRYEVCLADRGAAAGILSR